MTRRSLRLWTFAFALLGAFALTAHVGAKPPDLPVDPNETIPLLTPPEPFDYGTDSPYVAPPVETPETPETVMIYHPHRPMTPLSTQRTFGKCLLFGGHPLLSLIEMPESLSAEHEMEVVPAVTMPQSLLYGVGVNSDAGLTGRVVVTVGADGYERIGYDFNTMTGLTGRIVLNERNFDVQNASVGGSCVLIAVPSLPYPLCVSSEAKEPCEKPPVAVCPWKCADPCDHRVPALADVDMSCTVAANLEKLLKAQKLYEKACSLEKSGKYVEACTCLKEACVLCPGSRYEEMSANLVLSIVCKILNGTDDTDAAAEEQEQPPTKCPPTPADEDDNCCSGCCVDHFWLMFPVEKKCQKGCCDAAQGCQKPCCNESTVRTVNWLFGGYIWSKAGTMNHPMRGCGMPCCQAPGVEQQVTGLMKACHLALGCGCHIKAAELARQAYALDSERVAADPIVYKMHLLPSQKEIDDFFNRANDMPRDQVGPCVENPPAPCVRVEMRPPALPPVDGTVVLELEKLTAEDEVATAKPYLEVVEEESEVHEVPKAIDKPFCVRSSPTGAIVSFDDMLRFLPGEMWTEFDSQTNHARLLWRVRVGGAVYRMHFDNGDLSIGLSVMPMTGGVEDCEEK